MRQLFLPMRIWDLPTRLFHWVLVLLVLTSWASAEFSYMRIHVACGFSIMTLVIFRVLWGLVGSDTARFAHFLQSPLSAVQHLMHITRREPDTEVGHNAAGGWMVPGFLAILAIQIATGLCANDDATTEGPLALRVGKDWSNWLTHIHYLNFRLIQIAVALHVLAIVMYRVLKGHNLLLPMITGKKRLPGNTRAPRMMHPVLGLAMFAVAGIAVFIFGWWAY